MDLREDYEGITEYVRDNPHEEAENVIKEYVSLVNRAFKEEHDNELGKKIGEDAKRYILNDITYMTNGLTFKELEEMAQKRKDTSVFQINAYYDVLLAEAPYILDSFMLYVERHRKRKERFYEPRRKTLKQITDALQELEEDKLDELFVHMPARTGKLISDDTPVFTSEGWKKHGDLKVGDKVIGSDGNYTKVIQVHEKHHTTHTVIFQDGSSIDCHENHEWTIYDRRSGRYRTVETKAMIGHLKNGTRNNFLLPYRPIMDGEYKEFDLPPYLLGVWLGDGTNTKPFVTGDKDDYAIIEKIKRLGFDVEREYTHKTTGVKTYGFGRKLVDALRKYNMCFYTHTMPKHIPVEYLTASIPQRLQLLAGLIDTDGCLVRKERRYQFTTSSEDLKNDVETLINTFGWRVCTKEIKPKTSSSGIVGKHKYWVVSFNPTCHIPCALPRKRLYEFSSSHRMGIEAIVESKSKSGNCITVENKDGLYAVGKNMQLTHNSQLITMYTVWHCSRDTESSNLYVTYKEGLGGAFLEGVMEIIKDPTYAYADVFPLVRIADTDAKNNKLDLDRKKKYKSLSGKGLESGLNGEYDAYGVLILDDVLAGIEDVLSPEVLKRKQTIFDNNVMRRAKENCKKIFNGTIWATNDIYMDRQNFLENDPSAKNVRYKIVLIPALDPVTDESNFDYDYGVGFSTEYYRMTRAKFEANSDMAGWYAQCQQMPIDRTGAIFEPEHMKYYSVLPDTEPLKVITHIDIALGGADYLAMPVVYYYEDSDGGLVGYVEDVVFDNSEKHITQPQVISKIKKHMIKHVHFEANQGGEGYADDIRRMLKEDKDYREVCNITTDWAMVTKRKQQRIWDNAEEIRKLYFKDPQHRDMQYKKFMQNLFSFSMNMSKRQHEDAADALSGLIDFERHGTGIKKARIMRSPI